LFCFERKLKKSVWYPDHSDFGSKFKYTVKKALFLVSCFYSGTERDEGGVSGGVSGSKKRKFSLT